MAAMYQMARVDEVLYPALQPFAADWFDAGEGHSIYFEQCGAPAGLPVLFLHGGPGSGCSPQHRRLFDPQRLRAVLFDQRGCGRSRPRGELRANTSAHLVADIERLRRHLGIERWLVVGGSWGAGLALAYAVAHPSACLGLLLRGVFLGRQGDLDWFFQRAQQLLPDAWEALAERAPQAARERLLHWLAEGLLQGPPQQALERALAWEAWEISLSQQRCVPPRTAWTVEDAAQMVDKYRVQSHYLVNGCFWGDDELLVRAARLPLALPVALVHGRQDWICLPQAAWQLHGQLPNSRLQWVDACGHSPFEPAMAKALNQALLHFADNGDFNGWGMGLPAACNA